MNLFQFITMLTMELLLRQIISNTNEIVAATRPSGLIIKAKKEDRFVEFLIAR